MTQGTNRSDHRVGLAALPDRTLPGAVSYADDSVLGHLVHDALLAAGLGREHPDVPLADLIRPGMTVLLKPNWVHHQNFSGHGSDCMVTHERFVLAALKEVSGTKPGRVIIGDAPLQICAFERVVSPEFRTEVQQLAGCPVDIMDFRRTVLHGSDLADGVTVDARDEREYILFDLGRDSLLEHIAASAGRFRVTNYNPDELARVHRPGCHQYLLCREAFEADVVLNLPKLKTHKKAGITGALKNLVGINGNKEYLPHHRLGGSTLGGDCYPGSSPLKSVIEFCLDNANRRIGTEGYQQWSRAASRLHRWQSKVGDPEIEGGWYGNDTVWRMVLDLNRLLLHGRRDGTLSDTPVRTIYTLTDAIVAGELDGPLAPVPVNLGVVTFASSAPFADLVHSLLMHFDWRKIPLIRAAFDGFRYPLTEKHPEDCEVYAQQRRLSLEEIADVIGLDFQPPRGWKGHVELLGTSR